MVNRKLDAALAAITKPKKIRRLFFDIETSPNIVFSWSVGHKLSISYDNIIKERAIICICWKWEHESKVHSLEWDNGDDRAMVLEFAKVLEQADEVIGHNSISFDLKWFRTRLVFHGIPFPKTIRSVDSLRIARQQFRFNSNRLDYIGQYLGLGGKHDHDFGMWKSVALHSDRSALSKMLAYCKRDVRLLEAVYHRIVGFSPVKTHAGVLQGGDKSDCPQCASKNIERYGFDVTPAGTRRQVVRCKDCGRTFRVSLAEMRRRDRAKWDEEYLKRAKA